MGGVRDVAILGYVLIILASGILLGWRHATAYTLTSIVAIWWLASLGIGIGAEYHERIFNIFERLDPKTEGTGIGLTITSYNNKL